MEEFCNLNGLTSLIKKSTSFKNPDKPTCIDLILANQPNCFQQSNVFKTGLSDLHLLTVTEFKMGFQNLPSKTVNYRDYKNFDNEKFRSDISKFFLMLVIWKVSRIQSSVFLINMPLLKYIRENEALFMTKELHKAIMKRSKLRNNFLKSKTFSNSKAYTSQRNFCKKLPKEHISII